MKQNWTLATAAVMAFILILPLTPVKAIVGFDWVNREQDPIHGDDLPIGVLTDSLGNVYVAGHSYHNSTQSNDYLAIKYAADGSLVWRVYYSGPGNPVLEEPNDMVMDGQGNLYMTGFINPQGASYEAATVCISPNGQILWDAIYTSPSNNRDFGRAIAVDHDGNVYITGNSDTAQYVPHIITIKYNSLGEQQWVASYTGPGGGDDNAVDVAVDQAGNVYVTGYSDVSPGTVCNYDYVTIKYNSSGIQQWVANYNGTGDDQDYPIGIVLDETANVYVTGTSDNGSTDDCVTVKYNSTGTQLWISTCQGAAGTYRNPEDMKLDRAGNLLIAGYQTGGDVSQYFTLKLSNGGIQQWVRYHQWTRSTWNNRAHAVTVDDDLNVYVTGNTSTPSYGMCCETVKYDSTGNLKWFVRYDDDNRNIENGLDVTTDRSNNVLVAASFIFTDQAEFDFLTLKYHQNQGDISVGMIPTVSPIQIPAGGGSFSYHLTTINGVRDNLPIDVWWQIDYPGAFPRISTTQPQHRILPLDTCTTMHTQPVPASAPAGAFQYIIYTGEYPGMIWVTDTLTFQKLPSISSRSGGDEKSDLWESAEAEGLCSYSSGLSIQRPSLRVNVSPNPANPSTTIRFNLPEAAQVTLEVIDIGGRLVGTQYVAFLPAGTQAITFDGSNLPSGVYLYRLTAGKNSASGKMVLMK